MTSISIDLIAFTDDHEAIRGRLELHGNRLADLLATGRRLATTALRIRGLGAGSVTDVGDHPIDTARLVVVMATGPQGSRYDRVQTIQEPVTVHAGRYRIHGHLHTPVRSMVAAHTDRRPWFAVTEAVLEYACDGVAIRERYPTLLVNRAHAKAVILVEASSYEARWLASAPPADWMGAVHRCWGPAARPAAAWTLQDVSTRRVQVVGERARGHDVPAVEERGRVGRDHTPICE